MLATLCWRADSKQITQDQVKVLDALLLHFCRRVERVSMAETK